MDISFHAIRQQGHVGLFKPCSTNRLFVPELLPDVDATIYMDADTLAMTDLATLWRHFSYFNETQELAATREGFQCGNASTRCARSVHGRESSARARAAAGPTGVPQRRPATAPLARTPLQEVVVRNLRRTKNLVSRRVGARLGNALWHPITSPPPDGPAAFLAPSSRRPPPLSPPPQWDDIVAPTGINAGILLMNLTRLRATGAVPAWEHILSNRTELYLGDQARPATPQVAARSCPLRRRVGS